MTNGIVQTQCCDHAIQNDTKMTPILPLNNSRDITATVRLTTW